MTPSGWHEEGPRRDAGHDGMQVSLYRHLKQYGRTERELRSGSDEKSAAFTRKVVEIEYPFKEKGHIVGFADVCEVFQERGTGRYWFVAYEVKPEIWSVGGLLRQCKAMEAIMRRIRPDGTWNRPAYEQPPLVSVIPALVKTDRKLELFKSVWDGDIHLMENRSSAAAPPYDCP